MNLEQLKSLKHVKILAKTEAQKTHEDQRIFETIIQGEKVYDFKPARNKRIGIEVVKYTRRVKPKKVSKDTENGEPASPGKRKSKSTRKEDDK